MVVSWKASDDAATTFYELLHADETAAEGWVAVGFSEDQGMGDEAVVMATANGVQSRWNTGAPKGNVATDDFGLVGAVVQASEGMLYAAFEMPSIFEVVNPTNSELLVEDLACEHVYLVAGGDLGADGEPMKHDFNAMSENFISVCPTCPCTEEE